MVEPSAAVAATFEDVVRPRPGYLCGSAVRLVGDRWAAGDLVQGTLARAFRGSARLRTRERPRLC